MRTRGVSFCSTVTMDPTQIIFNGIVGVAAFLCAWQFKSIFEQIKESQIANAANLEKINQLRSEMGRHDERGSNMQRTLDAIFDALRGINEKLDRKADK